MKRKCIICGKPAEYRIPYTVCDECSEVIHKWENIRKQYNKTLKKAWQIEPMKMPSENLQLIADRLADIKENVHWIENIMHNIVVETKITPSKK